MTEMMKKWKEAAGTKKQQTEDGIMDKVIKMTVGVDWGRVDKDIFEADETEMNMRVILNVRMNKKDEKMEIYKWMYIRWFVIGYFT